MAHRVGATIRQTFANSRTAFFLCWFLYPSTSSLPQYTSAGKWNTKLKSHWLDIFDLKQTARSVWILPQPFHSSIKAPSKQDKHDQYRAQVPYVLPFYNLNGNRLAFTLTGAALVHPWKWLREQNLSRLAFCDFVRIMCGLTFRTVIVCPHHLQSILLQAAESHCTAVLPSTSESSS